MQIGFQVSPTSSIITSQPHIYGGGGGGGGWAAYSYTGENQSYTVPAGITSLQIKVWGAGGGSGTIANYSQGCSGAPGGYATGTMAVSEGQTYIIVVGEGGVAGYSASDTTWTRGGSNHGNAEPTSPGYGGGGFTENMEAGCGGGFSGIFITSVTQGNARVMAGGGGGGGSGYDGGNKGNTGWGGGPNGGKGVQSGTYQGGFIYAPLRGGLGGTQAAGGAAGTDTTNSFGNGTAGTALTGGTGVGQYAGGAGGGGYYGGGGAGYYSNGGGGSGHIHSSITDSAWIMSDGRTDELNDGSGGSDGAPSTKVVSPVPNSSDAQYVSSTANGRPAGAGGDRGGDDESGAGAHDDEDTMMGGHGAVLILAS